MPGNHCEISVDEQNGGDNDNEKKTRKKKKKKDEDDDSENVNQLETPPIAKSRKRFLSKIRRKPKSPKRCSSPLSRSGSRSNKGGCFSAMRPRRRDYDPSSSPPSDPNDESFTHDMLRVMLETNDFSSNDCNPHR